MNICPFDAGAAVQHPSRLSQNPPDDLKTITGPLFYTFSVLNLLHFVSGEKKIYLISVKSIYISI